MAFWWQQISSHDSSVTHCLFSCLRIKKWGSLLCNDTDFLFFSVSTIKASIGRKGVSKVTFSYLLNHVTFCLIALKSSSQRVSNMKSLSSMQFLQILREAKFLCLISKYEIFKWPALFKNLAAWCERFESYHRYTYFSISTRNYDFCVLWNSIRVFSYFWKFWK